MLELPVAVPNAGWDPRLLAFRSAEVVTVFAVLTRRWTVLVDTLYSEAGVRELVRQVLEVATPPGGGAAPPLLVVNTHADWDHAWGNHLFAGAGAPFPAPVLATAACAQRMREPGEAALLAQMSAGEPARFAGASLTPPTLAFEGSLRIEGGDLTLELLPAPGHKPDQLVVWIPEIRTLLGADATEHPMPFVEGPGHLAELVATLERLRALEPEFVLACHDRLDGDPGLLDRNLAYFARVWAAASSHPGGAVQDEALEEALGLPFAEFAEGVPPGAWDFYRDAHRRALRAALVEARSHGGGPSGRPVPA